MNLISWNKKTLKKLMETFLKSLDIQLLRRKVLKQRLFKNDFYSVCHSQLYLGVQQ